ncbi:S-adenosyl-L-methionine-dependent methyltransferase [Sesbania bispinosa]|nr:S-adenosyl-L-methionine-dependent methyltransferase [Sesbania bispinosa]
MAKLFVKQAKQYADLATVYKNVIATDVSEKQLEFATKLPNVRYQHTPSTMSMAELEQKVAPQGTIDLVTIAQAIHWFHLPNFYQQVKWVLKKPHGVIAAWCYHIPRFSDAVDLILDQLYSSDAGPYWDPSIKLIDNNYRSIDFPFEPVDGADHTGPFEFVAETVMDLDDLLTFIRTWSAYQTAKEKGLELLGEDVVEKFKLAWGEDGQKVAKFPIYMRIGRVGDA